MAAKSEFETFLNEELKKYRDISFPIHSSWLRRLLVSHCACNKLHPNPDDEFCDPSIGPSDRIISEYMQSFHRAVDNGEEYCIEPILVERMYPDGYIILNGHHRWAAAMKLHYKKIHVKILNLTHEAEIQKILSRSRRTKRVTLDLDEVVFLKEYGPDAEPSLPFPLNKIYGEPLRKGIPSLFYFLAKRGYDIWVYTNRYTSVEHIRHYFKFHRTSVTGVITGLNRKNRAAQQLMQKMSSLISEHYQTTLHIDEHTVLRTSHGVQQFDEYALKDTESWAQQIMDIIKRIDSHEA